MIGCVAAGGSGTRMRPITKYINKHMICCGPNGELMIDYPLHHLSLLGFEEVQVVTGTEQAGQVSDYVQDGERYGFKRVEYRVQPKPAGIADIIVRLKHVIKREETGFLLILGDNYFSEPQSLSVAFKDQSKAGCWEYILPTIEEAGRFGQIVYDERGEAVNLVEKPKTPLHTGIVTGLYYFPADVWEVVEKLEPSQRGELEITDLLALYAKLGRLNVNKVHGEWFDLGVWETWAAFVSREHLRNQNKGM